MREGEENGAVAGPKMLSLLSLYFEDSIAKLRVLQANLKAVRAIYCK